MLARLTRTSLVLSGLGCAAFADVLLVDPSGGPGTYAEIQAAIDDADGGDTLVVFDGSYAPITLSKRLSILADGSATSVHVRGVSRVEQVLGFRFAGLSFDALDVSDVGGSGIVESCGVGNVVAGGADPDVEGALHVRDCADLVVTGSELHGFLGCCGDSPWPTGQGYGAGSAGLRSEESRVTVVDSTVRGGSGQSGCFWNTGGSGIEVRGGLVVLAGCRVVGGGGGAFQCIAYGDGDPGGDAIWAVSGNVVVRGAGPESGTPFDSDHVTGGGGSWNDDGFGIRTEGEARAYWSGTAVSSTLAAGGPITELAKAEAFLELRGDAFPGGTVELDARAPAGELLVVVFGLSQQGLPPFELLGWEGSIWLDPGLLVGASVLVAQGQTVPLLSAQPLPAALAAHPGLILVYQAFAPGTPGSVHPAFSLVTNPATAIVR